MGKSIVCLVMVTLICSVLLQAASAAQSRDGQGEYRTFTDGRSRSVQARTLEVSGDRVTLQRSDGRRFTVAISGLSEADQTYLHGLTKSATAAAGDGDWPAFRGPGGMGVSGATGLPVEWDANRNVAWKTALPGAGASTPIVFGDRIYLTAYTGYFVPGEPGGSLDQLQRHLLALRLEDGRILWDKAIPAKLPEEDSIREAWNTLLVVTADSGREELIVPTAGEVVYEERLPRSGQFYASALLADGRLYYLTRSGKMFVLAAKPQFEQLAVNELSDRSVFNASPAVAGNRLLIRSDTFLYCLQAD